MKLNKYALLMTMGAVFWAGAFIAGKLGVGDTTPLMLTYFRFFVAIVFMYPYLKWRKVDLRIEPKDWVLMFTIGLIGMTGYHLLFFRALQYTTAMKASMLAATNPLITAILASFVLKDKLSLKKMGFIGIALLGVLLTLGNWDLSILWHGGFNIGDTIMLSAVTCWAIYGIIVRKNIKHHSPLVMTFYSFVTCLILLTPFFTVEVMKYGVHISKTTWIAIVYMGIFPTFIGYLIQQIAIKELGVSKMALFINLVPVFSMFMAVTILKEELFLLNLLSSGMILYSVYRFVTLETK